MKLTFARAAAAGALLATATPLAAPSQATCGPVVEVACYVVCRVGSDEPAIRSLCAIL